MSSKKTNNWLDRMEGNIVPEMSYEAKTEQGKVEEKSQTREEIVQKKIGNNTKFANQRFTIKVPYEVRLEMDILKELTRTSYDYEIIQWLIDKYKITMTTDDRKDYQTIKDIKKQKF